MTHFVCVHSPLTGPFTWAGVRHELERRGHTVDIPALRAERPPYWAGFVEQVVAFVEQHAPDDVDTIVLAGHSGAGALLPPIGNSIGVEAYLFVDAVLPRPDTSSIASMHPAMRAKLASLARDGMLPAWDQWWDATHFDPMIPDPADRAAFVSELQPIPMALLDEVVPPVDEWPDAPCGYLRLSGAYELEEAHAARSGWAVTRVDGTHLHPITHPEEVATRLLSLLVRLGVGG